MTSEPNERNCQDKGLSGRVFRLGSPLSGTYFRVDDCRGLNRDCDVPKLMLQAHLKSKSDDWND